MRALGQPEVIKSATVAALCTSVACYPRLMQAPQLHYPTWYLEALVFLGGTVLWAFVFAWHTKYSRRPVFALDLAPGTWTLATVLGIVTAILLELLLDPALRVRTPEDYPANVPQWVAMTLFSLGFTQLFLVFAPFAWLLRLFQRVELAVVLTVLFGVFVFAVKNRAAPEPIPPLMLVGLLVFRVAGGFLSVYFFLRGGVLLAWWWALLIHLRHLFWIVLLS
jgi:hypothetical protein